MPLLTLRDMQVSYLSSTSSTNRILPGGYPGGSVISDARGHLLSADLGQVACHHAIIECVEQQQDSHVHPEVRFNNIVCAIKEQRK